MKKRSSLSSASRKNPLGTMRTRKSALPQAIPTALSLALSALVILTSLPAFATSPLAIRVEVQPTAIAADGTVMTLEVQLAPSDRGRIGRQARMRVKLLRGTKTTAHILQDVDFDGQGMTRVEYTWPPGTYQLSLTVESLRGTAQGLWMGEVHIPESLNPAPTFEATDPKTEPSVGPTDPIPEPSPPDVVAPIVTTVPVVTSPKVEEKRPAPATKSTTAASPPAQPPTETPEVSPPVPEPPAPIPPTEPLPSPTPAAEPPPLPTPTPVPPATPEVPPARPVAAPSPRPSGPVYALVLDIDPLDIEVANRAADLRASIDRRAENVTPLIVQAGDSNPTVAVNRALDIARSHPETRAIVVLSDVRRKASRSEWKQMAASVQASGLPVFVIGLWTDESDPGTRKQFKNMATDSGGRSYQLQPSESPVRALEMLDSVLK